MKYAEVYTSIKTLEVNHPFDYLIPEAFKDSISPGSLVIVPFRNRQEIGFVTRIKDSTDVAAKDLKTVAEVISSIPVFTRETLKIIYWMSSYYLQPFGKIIEFFLPPGSKDKILKVFRNPETFFRYKNVFYLKNTGTEAFREVYGSKRFKGQQRILDLLKKNDGIELKEIIRGAGGSRSSLTALLQKGVVEVKKIRISDGYEGRVTFENPKKPVKGYVFKNGAFRKEIAKYISKNLFRAFILYDFRTEDKISLYRSMLRSALENNKKALLLTPEIIDAENLYSSIYDPELCGKQIIYHSELKESEQLSRWYEIYTGNADIVFGNRSAIFLPFKNIGLIVIDEEHDPSYKESTIVRYNVQDIALKIGRSLNIPVVFASNTPSMRLWYRAENDKEFKIIRPDVSFFKNNKVAKEVLDLKTVDSFKEDINITSILYKIIRNSVEAGSKALVFFNRRGYSSFLVCRDCGNIPLCPRCHISYSYHGSSGRLVCHHCSNSEDFTGQCSNCGSKNLQFRGTGIEKIESKLKKRFKGIAFLRVDSDFIRNKKESRAIQKTLSTEGSLLLLGTQKVLKYTVKDLTAASIINYDSLFQIPDFQINERVFQLLVQILTKIKNMDGSRFMIQSFNSENEVLGSFILGDYEDFYKKEIKKRKDLYYPPYSNLINIVISGRNDESVSADVRALAHKISSINKPGFLMLGPAPAPFHKRNLIYRWHIMIKTESVIRFNTNLREILKDFRKNDENKIVFDIDPVWIL
jgi:primosomal protein N' (replication factor Y)